MMILLFMLCALMAALQALAQNLDNPMQRYDRDSSTAILYHFDEDNGTTVANDGPPALFGSLRGGTWTSQGRFGGGMTMDAESRIRPARSLLFASDNLTMEMWVYQIAHVDVVFLMDTTKVDDFGQRGRVLGIDRDGHPFALAFREGSSPRYAESPSPLPLNTWIHLAGLWDEDVATVEVAVNGEIMATDDLDSDEEGSDSVTICQAQSIPLNRGFIGTIDEVRVSFLRRRLVPVAVEPTSWGAIKALYQEQ
jgi:hypothetical protein